MTTPLLTWQECTCGKFVGQPGAHYGIDCPRCGWADSFIQKTGTEAEHCTAHRKAEFLSGHKPRICSSCGEGTLARTARPGRTTLYRGMTLALPADLPLVECDNCQERYMTLDDCVAIDGALETLWRAMNE